MQSINNVPPLLWYIIVVPFVLVNILCARSLVLHEFKLQVTELQCTHNIYYAVCTCSHAYTQSQHILASYQSFSTVYQYFVL